MRKLTPEGEKTVAEVADRHGVSTDAVRTLLEAVANGGGNMAQFNHPELGGGGQWLRGGMTMVGDMFNHSLKAKVDAICAELSDRLAGGGLTQEPGTLHSQSQGGGGNWWPAELGNPSATGAQNRARYAFFPEKGRLAIDNNGRVEVYDTLDHLIQGFGQQQGGGSSLTFSSQHGPVRIDSLPRLGGESGETESSSTAPAAANDGSAPQSMDSDSAFATLERLAGLKEKGILSEEEFAAKKAEILKRL